MAAPQRKYTPNQRVRRERKAHEMSIREATAKIRAEANMPFTRHDLVSFEAGRTSLCPELLRACERALELPNKALS